MIPVHLAILGNVLSAEVWTWNSRKAPRVRHLSVSNKQLYRMQLSHPRPKSQAALGVELANTQPYRYAFLVIEQSRLCLHVTCAGSTLLCSWSRQTRPEQLCLEMCLAQDRSIMICQHYPQSCCCSLSSLLLGAQVVRLHAYLWSSHLQFAKLAEQLKCHALLPDMF